MFDVAGNDRHQVGGGGVTCFNIMFFKYSDDIVWQYCTPSTIFLNGNHQLSTDTYKRLPTKCSSAAASPSPFHHD